MPSQLAYMTPFLVAATMIALIGAYAWSSRRVRGGRLLVTVCFTAAYWSIFEGFLYLGLDSETNMLITKLQYLGIVFLPPLTLVLICTVFGLDNWLRPSRLLILFSISPLTLISVWTNDLHHLYYTGYYTISTGPFPMLGLVHGPLWYIHIVYHYLILCASTLILGSRITKSESFQRGQALVILIALLAVWVTNLIYVLGLSPIPNMDIAPIAFSLVAASFAWGFFRYSFLDILPVAKAEVFDGLSDPILVLDRADRIAALNPAGEALIGRRSKEILGLDVRKYFDAWPEKQGEPKTPRSIELPFQRNGEKQTYELRFSDLADRRKRNIGRLAVFRDISERKRLEEELTLLATTDPLTGAVNRRRLMELAETEFAKSRRFNRNLSVLMIDLDHFKKVNDSHGHDVGDEVLKDLVGTCLGELREVDVFGRLGGEEFTAVLIETDTERAGMVAERLRAKVQDRDIPTGSGPIRITISIGAAGLESRDASFQDLLKRADQALYRAKNEGRNRVALADDRIPTLFD